MVNTITKEELINQFTGDKTKMEETNNNKVNYEEESQKLQDAANRPDFWNPKEGKYEITILSELETYSYIDAENKNQDRAKVAVEYQGQEFVWGFGIGKTRASTYGQLVEVAKANDNKLTGKSVTVVIKSDGKKRDFTIV